MTKFVIAVINGTQARFFTYEPLELIVPGTRNNLEEHQKLSNPAKKLQGQLWANVKTGRNRGTNGQAHSYDDHRQDHIAEFDRQFVQRITDKIAALLSSYQTRQLIVVAEPQILGLMREALKSPSFKTVNIRELDKDICHFNSLKIHDYLAKQQFLPARERMNQ